MTFGTLGYGPRARSVLHCHCVLALLPPPRLGVSPTATRTLVEPTGPTGRRQPHLYIRPGAWGPGAGRGIAVRQLSPRRPCRRQTADHQKHLKSPAFYSVFCCSYFSHFSELMAQDGSTWANIGVKMDQHSPKMGQPSPKMGQDGPT